MFGDQEGGDQTDGGQEGRLQLIVARGQAAELFELIEETFDAVASAIALLVVGQELAAGCSSVGSPARCRRRPDVPECDPHRSPCRGPLPPGHCLERGGHKGIQIAGHRGPGPRSNAVRRRSSRRSWPRGFWWKIPRESGPRAWSGPFFLALRRRADGHARWWNPSADRGLGQKGGGLQILPQPLPDATLSPAPEAHVDGMPVTEFGG